MEKIKPKNFKIMLLLLTIHFMEHFPSEMLLLISRSTSGILHSMLHSSIHRLKHTNRLVHTILYISIHRLRQSQQILNSMLHISIHCPYLQLRQLSRQMIIQMVNVQKIHRTKALEKRGKGVSVNQSSTVLALLNLPK